VRNLEAEIEELKAKNSDLEHELTDIKYEHDLFNKYVITSETDLKGHITYVSQPFIEISGYEKEELIGKPHNIVRHPDMPSEIFKTIWDTIQSKGTWRGNVKNLKKDGSYYWVDSIVFPRLNYKNEIIGYKSMRIDITASKRLEDMLKKMFLNK